MGGQSSTAVVFRALVMLACLVAIPLAAVLGKSLPEIFGALLQGRWPAGSASAHSPARETAQFDPTGPAGAGSAALSDRITSQWQGLALQAPAVRHVGTVVSAGYEARSGPPPEPGASAASAPAAKLDRFTHIQNRLRQLGATYYLLESWGSGQQLYRFCCKMAVGGSPDYTRSFEATDSDPLRAMARVLEQVDAWRAGRK